MILANYMQTCRVLALGIAIRTEMPIPNYRHSFLRKQDPEFGIGITNPQYRNIRKNYLHSKFEKKI